MRAFLAIAVFLAFVPSSAFAHALGVDCALRAGKIEVEAFYDDNAPAQKARVQVVNAMDEVVATGVTDAKGQWAFAALPPGAYEVRVDAGAGHRAKKTIRIPGAEPSAPATPAVTISEGRTRAEFTRFPWLQVAIAVVVLGGVGGAFAISTALRKNGRS